MSSSELSNALNPNVVPRRPQNAVHYAPVYPYPEEALQYVECPLTIEQPQPYLPHRSELELAFIEPLPRRIPSAPSSPIHEQEQ